jgi:hypothetical protein
MYLSHIFLNILLLAFGANMVTAVYYCSNSGVRILHRRFPVLYFFLASKRPSHPNEFCSFNRRDRTKTPIADESVPRVAVISTVVLPTYVESSCFMEKSGGARRKMRDGY